MLRVRVAMGRYSGDIGRHRGAWAGVAGELGGGEIGRYREIQGRYREMQAVAIERCSKLRQVRMQM